jgi:hypothetical protein
LTGSAFTKQLGKKLAEQPRSIWTFLAGLVAIAPSNVRHSAKALTDGRVIITDYPVRRDFD